MQQHCKSLHPLCSWSGYGPWGHYVECWVPSFHVSGTRRCGDTLTALRTRGAEVLKNYVCVVVRYSLGVDAFEAANYKRLVLQLKVAICSVLNPLLRDRKFVLPAVAKLGGAYPAHCILPRFSVSESYLEYEIHFGTLTNAPRVATEVEGRYLILGKDTWVQIGTHHPGRVSFRRVCKQPWREADNLREESRSSVLFNDAVKC